jgi:hypothetical protein
LNIHFKKALTHGANIMRKPGCDTLIDLVRIAIGTGFIKPQPMRDSGNGLQTGIEKACNFD